MLPQRREGPTKGDAEIDQLYEAAEDKRLSKTSVVKDVLDISNVLTDGISAMVDDSFNKCFTSMRPEPWNWNLYLFPFWIGGVILRCVHDAGREGVGGFCAGTAAPGCLVQSHLRKSLVRRLIFTHYIQDSLLTSEHFACFASPAPSAARAATCLPHTCHSPSSGSPRQVLHPVPYPRVDPDDWLQQPCGVVSSGRYRDAQEQEQDGGAAQASAVDVLCLGVRLARRHQVRAWGSARQRMYGGHKLSGDQWRPLAALLLPEHPAAPRRKVLMPCGSRVPGLGRSRQDHGH